MHLFPYKNGSQGAKALAEGIGIKQIKKEGSKFKGSSEKLVINWGNSMSTEEVDKCAVLNKPAAVAICSNKLNFFRHIYTANESANFETYTEIPGFTTSRNDALIWLEDGLKVVCRTVLNGHSGEGIVIAENRAQLVDAPLYVEYRPKKTEYRVHVLNDRVVDVQRKARDHSVPEDQVNWQVRNHQFGFVFVRDEQPENIPRNVLTQALTAVKMVGLDFGAVDVIWNARYSKATVLEINTAPGLTGTTLEGYQKRLKEFGDIFDGIVQGRRNRRVVVDRGAMDEAKAEWVRRFDAGNRNIGRHPREIHAQVQMGIPDPIVGEAFHLDRRVDMERALVQLRNVYRQRGN